MWRAGASGTVHYNCCHPCPTTGHQRVSAHCRLLPRSRAHSAFLHLQLGCRWTQQHAPIQQPRTVLPCPALGNAGKDGYSEGSNWNGLHASDEGAIGQHPKADNGSINILSSSEPANPPVPWAAAVVGVQVSINPSNAGALEAASSQEPAPPVQSSKKTIWPPDVPWRSGKIFQVMFLWLLGYIILGQVAVPIVLSLFNLDRDLLSMRGQALLHLSLDLSQLAVTLLILRQCLSKFLPRQRGFFPVQWRGGWPLLVLACCSIFPLVDWVAQQSMTWFPSEVEQWANQLEQSLSMGDWITNVVYFSVVSICAPIWEEAIFRGFLLTSLTRYMPTPAAALASSLLFAMCHFRQQTFLPLLVLGMVFSAVFLASRNLLPPIVLHSAWNFFVLFNLLRNSTL